MVERRRVGAGGVALLAALVAVIVWLGLDPARQDAAPVAAPVTGRAGTTEVDPGLSAPAPAPAQALQVDADAAVPADDIPGGDDATSLRLFGVVSDPEGEAIAGALVSVHANGPGWADTEPIAEQHTAADGRFDITLAEEPASGLGVSYSAEGHVGISMSGAGWSQHETPVTLPWAMSVSGVVRDAQTDLPVAGARLKGVGEQEVETGSDGRYAFHKVGVGWQNMIMITHPDYAPAEERFQLNAPEPLVLDIALQRGVVLGVTVVDRETSAGLADVSLRSSRHADPWGQTDAAGRFTLRVGPGTERRVVVAREGYVDLVWTWDGSGAEEGMTPRLPLRRTTGVVGQVRDASGAAVGGAGVSVWGDGGSSDEHLSAAVRARFALPGTARESWGGDGGRTDAEGRFRLALAPSDAPRRVHASHGDYVDAESEPLVLQIPGEETWVELVLQQGGHIAGRALRNGRPLQWHGLLYRAATDDVVGYTQTDDEGGYTLMNMPAGEHSLALRDMHGEILASASVTVIVGQETRHDFELNEQLDPIEGRVLWASGEPAVEQGVSARPAGTHVQPRKAKTDDDGRFVLQVPTGGTFDVGAFHLRHVKLLGVPAGATGLELVLPLEGELRLELLDGSTGEPVVIDRAHSLHRAISWRSPGMDLFRAVSAPLLFGEAGPDNRGHCTLTLPVGPVELAIDLVASGYRPLHATGLVVAQEHGGPPTRLTLQPGLEAALRFVDDATGLGSWIRNHSIWAVPAAEAHLIRTPLPGESPSMQFGGSSGHRVRWDDPTLAARKLRQQEDGTVTARGLAPGAWALRIFPENITLQPSSFTLPRADEEPLEVRFRPIGAPSTDG